MKLKTTLMNGIAGAVLAVSAVAAQAETELRWASSAPAGTPWVKHSESFAEAFKEATGGDYNVALFNGSQLGTEVDVLKQVTRGRIAIGAVSTPGMATQVPEVSLLSAPYLFNSIEEVDCVYDNHLTDALNPLFEARNLKLLQWNELGFANMFGPEKIASPDQLGDMKVRVNVSPAAKNFYDALDVNGIYIPFSEMTSALQTGLIESGSMQNILYVAMGFAKAAPHLTLTNHSHDSGMIVMNLDAWKKMSTEDQAKLMAALPDQNGLRAGVRGMDAYLVGEFQKAGGQVYELTEEEKAVWRDLGGSKHAELVSEIGGGAEAFWADLTKAVADCRK